MDLGGDAGPSSSGLAAPPLAGTPASMSPPPLLLPAVNLGDLVLAPHAGRGGALFPVSRA